MAEKLLMLALSPTMETGVIARWTVSEGDVIQSGDVLCEVETDKATMDYESPADGVLLKIIKEAGSSASVGDTIGIIGQEDQEDEDIASLLEEATAEKKEAAEQPAGDAEQPKTDPAPEEKAKDQPDAPDTGGFIRSSPLARKLADQNDIDLKQIEGSGPAGRIVKADIEKAIAARSGQPAASRMTAAPSGQDVVIPVSGKRRIIAQRLSESKYTAPHYYLNIAVEMDDLMAARSRLNAAPDTKISVNAFLVKFAAEALKRHPRVNASWQGDSIMMYGRIDIGLAVAQEDGLITPVVRNCANKGIRQIDAELQDLIEKAQKQTLTPEEYTGATFTISSLGSFGIDSFTAIINPPGSAILAVGEMKKSPVVQPDDTLKIRQVMKMTLSCDHRVIDGAVGALFLADLRDMMQEPVRALY